LPGDHLLEDQIDADDIITGSNKENSTSRMAPTSEIVSYQHIQEKASELARTCQNDQPKMRTILGNLHRMIERVRDGYDIFITFEEGFVNMPNASNALPGAPRSAISRAIPNATGVKRLQSGREYNSRHKKKYRKHVTLSQVTNSNDDRFLPAPNAKSRSCTVCRQKGHGRGKCPLITKYGVSPFAEKGMASRHRLSKNLANISKYELEFRPTGDDRTILTELPAMREIKGLVIHRRYLANRALLNPYTTENICLECTLLHIEGVEHPSYTQKLFNTDCISVYLIRNQTNLIMCQVEESSGVVYPAPPQRQAAMSQMSQILHATAMVGEELPFLESQAMLQKSFQQNIGGLTQASNHE
jgi:hypothetical protein